MKFAIGTRSIQVFPSGNRTAPLVVINASENEGEEIHNAIGSDVSLAVVTNIKWNDDLTPWAADAVFRNGSPFGGKADDYLSLLTGIMIPYAVERTGVCPEYIAIAGYSLAGLFALYSAYRTGLFSRVASISGSLWYPGFAEYAKNHALSGRIERIYLSLGDREVRTQNPYMRNVEKETYSLSCMYGEQGIVTEYELNAGNHFQEMVERTVKGIRWIIQ